MSHIPRPKILKISILTSLGMLVFIELIATIPLTIYLLSNPEELRQQIRDEPFMVFTMTIGSVVVLICGIFNILLFGKKRVEKPLVVSYAVLISFLWTIIISIAVRNQLFEPIMLNIFFIPFYFQLYLMYKHQGSRQYIQYLRQPQPT